MNPIIKKELELFVDRFQFVNEIRNCTCLVTGATGLIGSTIIRCLLALNDIHNTNVRIVGVVRNLDKAHSLFGNSKVEWLVHDLSKPIQLNETVDLIFHCASPTSSKFYIENPVETILTSVQGSISLLEYAAKNPITGMVYLSSCEVYGTVSEDKEFDESYSGYVNPVNIRSGYPTAKRLVECLCHSYSKEYNVPVTIARLTQTFGAGVSMDDNRVFAQFAKNALNNKDIILHTKGESCKSYCYTLDAVNAFFFLIFKGVSGEAYNIANEASFISINDLAHYIANEFSTGSKVVIQENDSMGYAPTTILRMSTKKLRKLGWTPYYDLHDMFENLIKFYKNQC